MATALQKNQSTKSLPGLANALLQNGQFTSEQINSVLHKAVKEKLRFVDALVKSNLINPNELAVFCAQNYGYPLLDLGQVDASNFPEKIIDNKLSFSQQVIALSKRGNRLAIAISDPSNTSLLDQIKFQTQLVVEPVIVEHDKLLNLLEKSTQSVEQNLNELIGDEIEIEFGEEESEATSESISTEIDDAPVVKFLQKIMVDAIRQGASDIHFEPFEKYYRIRFRLDGQLVEVAQPPLAIKDKLASRIKVISRMDISEKRVPQDGRIKLAFSQNRNIEFRISTLPTLHGEKIVMRVLDPGAVKLGIEHLGYEASQKELLLNAVQRPYGMVLVTGPTGSGKTISLYSCLGILNKPDINISTAEDPVEINLPGVNQVQVNDKVGLTFSTALRAFLRQDPDVIMVGEIRDLDTADVAIKASQTGHMVFSTLHTNDAPSTLTRLANMGVAPFNIASSVILVTAQRLVRRLCAHCKRPVEILDEVLLQAGFTEEALQEKWKPYQATGCEHCNNIGYKGRVGIYQVMPISEAMQHIILAQGDSIAIAAQARKEGILSLREAGLLKVKQGLTSLEEVLGATNE